jgi:hypothetical protein
MGGTVLISLAAFYFFLELLSVNNCNNNATAVLVFTLVAALVGIITSINTWVNYQERDSKKLMVINDEVYALRQTLLEESVLSPSRSYGVIELVEPQSSSSHTAGAPAIKGSKSKTQDFLVGYRFGDIENGIQQTC